MRGLKSGLMIAAVAAFSSAATAAGPAWHVEPLPDSATASYQGCLGTFSVIGDKTMASVFIDDSTDTKARASIKLGGKVYDLVLVSVKRSGKEGPDSVGPGSQSDRVFKDKTGAVVVESLVKVTKQNPDTDSVEMAGSLSVKFMGGTQTLKIEGGVAC